MGIWDELDRAKAAADSGLGSNLAAASAPAPRWRPAARDLMALAVLAGCGAEERVPVDTSDYGPVCDCANTPPWPQAELVYANLRCMGSGEGGGLLTATAYWDNTPYSLNNSSARVWLHLFDDERTELLPFRATELVPDADFGGRVEAAVGAGTEFDCGDSAVTTWVVQIHERCWAYGEKAADPEWLESRFYTLGDCVPFTPGWQ